MSVFGISMVRDEADIIEATIRHMLCEVDAILIADNGSTDGTREILEDLPVMVRDDPELGYYQSRKMSALAHEAYNLGAHWVVPFDADECWYSPFGRIADELKLREESISPATLYDHVPTSLDPEGNPVERIGWRRHDPTPLPKVACRTRPYVTIHQGNHGADYGQTIDLGLVVRHYPYRSAEQMIRKARNGAGAYAATDLPEDVGQHWRDYGRLSDEQLADVFERYFHSADPESDPNLIFDPCPSKSLSPT